jgi:biotin-[acetyl-CoA-carboxylase] ligase BirA-like protein
MNEFVIHEVVDSTSAEAQRMCAAQHKAPFAVMAKLQTAGRGRRGRGWSSTPGNLMMTVVLPAELWTSGPERETAPLKAAVLVARFIREHFGIRITLKWPNDLLFAGRKLGGILCESSSTGASFGELLIGIGLNIAAAPHLSGPDSVGTICLEDIVGRQSQRLPDVAIVGRELAAWLLVNWTSLESQALPACFAEYGITTGQIFVSSDQTAVNHGIDATGALVLETHKDLQKLHLTSADQPWRWIYQDLAGNVDDPFSGESAPILIADVGNSRIKCAVWKSVFAKAPVFSASFTVAELASVDWAGIVRAASPAVRQIPLVCHTVSVSQTNMNMFSEVAKANGISVQSFEKRPVLLRTSYLWQEIGADRVAAIEGFLAGVEDTARGDANSIGIVVCAGTATTIDAVTFAGRHLGGVIIPGLTTSLNALHEAAPALPDLSREAAKISSVDIMAMSTHDAILGGERAMVAGAIQVLVEAAKGDLNPQITVVFTGGHANTVMLGFKKSTTIECNLVVKEHLILEGARSMVLGGVMHGAFSGT